MNKLSVGNKKIQLIVIGKTKDSRSLHDPEQLSVWYSSNTKAWITQCFLFRTICAAWTEFLSTKKGVQ